MGDWDKFGRTWVQIIANPAGYVAQRKTPTRAAQDYIKGNPVNVFIREGIDERAFLEARGKWVDACASQLKSDDVGKSKANCVKACESVFDKDPYSLSVQNQITDLDLFKKIQSEEAVEQRTKIFMAIIVVAAVLLLGYLVIKNRNIIK